MFPLPIFRIPDQHLFPDPELAEPSGLLGVGGDLDPDRVELAYRMGIFPWYSRGEPILWWSPDPRMVMAPSELRIGRSLKKRVRRGDYAITMDRAFADVIAECGSKPRPGQSGTWITPQMRTAYVELHHRGIAHSVEAWKEGELVGGLYGISLGKLFAGESMFAHASDASKVAYVHLVRQLERWDMSLVDCQVHTDHLARFGAREIPRRDYLHALRQALAHPTRRGPWDFDGTPPLR